ncbi:MAG: aminotransferase class III-fold pyridoxal phosphate-dependent enzyme [Pseudomonadota bacterium]
MLTNDQLAAWDRDSFFHPSTALGEFARGEAVSRIIEGGEGCRIRDRDGRTFLDGFAGLYCVNVGYGRQEIADAIAAQARELAYYHAYAGHGTEASITLAKMVLERAPEGMSKIYFGLSGSDANETAVKLVWSYHNLIGKPDKKKIISRWRGYHGSGLMTGSLTGLPLFHKTYDLPLARVLHTEAPVYLYRPDAAMSEEEFSAHCAKRLEEMIEAEGADTIAAFIAEPMLGTGGIVPPPAGYWEAVQPILKKHDILIIADEVVCGFGRLGSMFGSTHYGIAPDFMSIAKGLTSAYAPLSGSIVSKRVFDVLAAGTDASGMAIGHGWTYSAHPIGAAAGVANLKLVDELGLLDNARTCGAVFLQMLRERLGAHQHVAEVRGEGLLAAVEFHEDKSARKPFDPGAKIGPKIAAALAARGVIGRAMPGGDILGFAPPLCLTEADAAEIADAAAGALADVFH